MGEGLKLASLHGGPFAGTGLGFPDALRDAGEKTGLRRKRLRCQPGGFPGGLQRGEIYMRGDVLSAGIRQEIIAGLMTPVSS